MQYLGRALQVLGLAAVYVATGKLGLMVFPVGQFATFVWPPSGLALAALLLAGNRVWPGVWLGAFVLNAWAGASPLVALGIATGNSLEALIGATGLRRIPGFRTDLERFQDAAGLVVRAALISTVASASIGVSSLVLGG